MLQRLVALIVGFAIRYRRRMKGKRIRVYERAATARGWSHARTILMARLPIDEPDADFESYKEHL